MWQEQGEPGGSSPAAGRRGRPTGSRRAGRQFGFYSEGSGESWKPERTQSDPSGRRRESAREAGLSVRTWWSRKGEGALGPGTQQGWISAPITPHPQQGSLV